MRRQLEHAVKYKRTALEKYITPVPSIILYDMVRLRLNPKIECDQRNPANPPVQVSKK